MNAPPPRPSAPLPTGAPRPSEKASSAAAAEEVGLAANLGEQLAARAPERKARDAGLILPAIGLALFLPPAIDALVGAASAGGPPRVALYVFGVWAALILAALFLAAPLKAAAADPAQPEPAPPPRPPDDLGSDDREPVESDLDQTLLDQNRPDRNRPDRDAPNGPAGGSAEPRAPRTLRGEDR